MEKARFPQFYKKHLKTIYRFVYYRVGANVELAQDITQDVFLKALEAFERYDEAISGSAWIFTIARNHLITVMSKQRPNVDLEEIENTIWDHDDGVNKMELHEDERRLIEALKQIPKEDAELLRKKHLEGWTYDEIAEQMGKKSGALRIQSYRAIKQLRTILKKR